MIGVYGIFNDKDGRAYIGSSTNIEVRFGLHKSKLNRNIHSNPHLQAAWNFQVEEDFRFVVLEELEDTVNMIELEQLYIDKFDTYNVYKAAPTASGYQLSEDFRQRRSEIMQGNTIRLGLKASDEKREKDRQASTGRKYPNRRPMPEGFGASVSARMKGNTYGVGYTYSPEARAEMSRKRKGNNHRPIGTYQHSEETLAKMRASRAAYLERKRNEKAS